MGFKWRFEYSLLLLLLLSAAAIRFSDDLLQRVRVIEPEGAFVTESTSDRVHNSGNTETRRAPGRGYDLRCRLREGFGYPYCGIVVRFDPQRVHGIDLSGMRRLRLWLDYEGPAQTVKIHLRNASPHYGLPQQEQESAKYNHVEITTDSLRHGMVELDLRDFVVANWWMQQFRMPPQFSRPEFDNIISLEVITGTDAPIGDYRLVLHRVEYDVQYLSTERWYLAIMSMWLVLALLYLLQRMVRLKADVSQQRQRSQELYEINRVLDARSKQLVQMATTDALTGAFNRKGLEDLLQQALADWHGHRHPLGLVLIDLDHFKAVNDIHGHQAGDHVLAGLAELVRQHVRGQDALGRWGGEEFLLVCRDTGLVQATAIAEKLRALIAGHEFHGGLHITASFGVAALDSERPLDQVFAAADGALYRAKAEGRNSVVAESVAASPTSR
ncbi:GGDEF domain-containing protein [Roseateles cellulosilyticus]|uniref:diguanylate cyclase n=1 Tax=Pelomonas cellulosilytica TaxID=2906762 RepID=A0ABS8XT12_9BURK|nr:GGDEF domain-containing protein [Pelomonas sp. P8]MCE4554440.1 GGDEF domain-containing protein [Pelomonas sp. P8]